MGNRPKLSVVVPCFNEEELLESCIAQCSAWLKAAGVSHEIVIVDDGSKDRSPEIARDIARKIPEVRLFLQEQNRGVGKAIGLGFGESRGEWCFTQCVDMPFDIGDLRHVLPRLDGPGGPIDILVARRNDRSANSPFRKLTSLTNYWVIRGLFGVPVGDYQFVQFYKVDSIRDLLPLESEGSFAPPELLYKSWKKGLSFAEISLDFHPRTAGEAKCGRPTWLAQSLWEIVRFRARAWLRRNRILSSPQLLQESKRDQDDRKRSA